VFGSVCYKHVLYQLRRKLDDKSISLLLIGFHSTSGYKLFDPNTGKAIVSRNVVVDEVAEWDEKASQ